jgi:hypothetical protein
MRVARIRGCMVGIALAAAGGAVVRGLIAGDADCGPAEPRRVLAVGESADVGVWPRDRCTTTAWLAVAGARYRAYLVLPKPCRSRELERPPEQRHSGQWADGRVPIGSPAGASALDGLRFGWTGLVAVLALPLRRDLGRPWLAASVTISDRSQQHVPLGSPPTDFVASQTGPLDIRINDAVLPLITWDAAYRNNAGGPARLRIVRLADADGATPAAPTPYPPYTCEEQETMWAAR